MVLPEASLTGPIVDFCVNVINDTGLVVKTTSLSAWRADGTPVTKAQLGDPGAFSGNGYMLLGLEADAVAQRYRDASAKRGGPMMLLTAPTSTSPFCTQVAMLRSEPANR